MVEITLDVRNYSVSMQNICGGDSEMAFLASRLEKQLSSLLARPRQVSQELKCMASVPKAFDRVTGASLVLRVRSRVSSILGFKSDGGGEICSLLSVSSASQRVQHLCFTAATDQPLSASTSPSP